MLLFKPSKNIYNIGASRFDQFCLRVLWSISKWLIFSDFLKCLCFSRVATRIGLITLLFFFTRHYAFLIVQVWFLICLALAHEVLGSVPLNSFNSCIGKGLEKGSSKLMVQGCVLYVRFYRITRNRFKKFKL